MVVITGGQRTHCPRNPGGQEAGCDAHACYLEGNTGWDNYKIGAESNGEGCRNEFHRRRMVRFSIINEDSSI